MVSYCSAFHDIPLFRFTWWSIKTSLPSWRAQGKMKNICYLDSIHILHHSRWMHEIPFISLPNPGLACLRPVISGWLHRLTLFILFSMFFEPLALATSKLGSINHLFHLRFQHLRIIHMYFAYLIVGMLAYVVASHENTTWHYEPWESNMRGNSTCLFYVFQGVHCPLLNITHQPTIRVSWYNHLKVMFKKTQDRSFLTLVVIQAPGNLTKS